MANSEKTLSDMAQDTTQLIHEATEKTAETVIAHTHKYNDAYSTINKMVDAFWDRVPYFLIALSVFTIFYIFSRLFKFFVRKLLSDRAKSKQNLVLVLNRVGSTVIVFLGFLIAMMIAVPSFTPGQLMSALGLSSVAIGFAFKDIFQNLLSGILILLTEPFKIGDDIVVSGMEGTVEDIQIRATYLRSPDGRRILIPNATAYTNVVTVNTAYPRRRCEFTIGIGYENDVQKAKDIIRDILDHDISILSAPSFSINVTTLSDFNINLKVLWWVNTSDIATSASISAVQERVLKAFTKHNISLPYPRHEIKLSRDVSPDTELTQGK